MHFCMHCMYYIILLSHTCVIAKTATQVLDYLEIKLYHQLEPGLSKLFLLCFWLTNCRV